MASTSTSKKRTCDVGSDGSSEYSTSKEDRSSQKRTQDEQREDFRAVRRIIRRTLNNEDYQYVFEFQKLLNNSLKESTNKWGEKSNFEYSSDRLDSTWVHSYKECPKFTTTVVQIPYMDAINIAFDVAAIADISLNRQRLREKFEPFIRKYLLEAPYVTNLELEMEKQGLRAKRVFFADLKNGFQFKNDFPAYWKLYDAITSPCSGSFKGWSKITGREYALVITAPERLDPTVDDDIIENLDHLYYKTFCVTEPVITPRASVSVSEGPSRTIEQPVPVIEGPSRINEQPAPVVEESITIVVPQTYRRLSRQRQRKSL
ncbi:hypothetical protein TWF173_000859 [Orbilia oligospora]|nr:hypothetical protein TWF173_000859 [Orbilia oligospora]